MMNLTKTVGYAVHALSCLEKAAGRPLLIQEIAEQTGVRKPYLARLMNRLVHEGLVASKRGYRGGVVLALPADQIPLVRIVVALEGREWSRACFFGLSSCPAGQACPAHAMWAGMRRQIEGTLQGTTLAELTRATQPKQKPARAIPTTSTARLAPPAATASLPPQPSVVVPVPSQSGGARRPPSAFADRASRTTAAPLH